MNSALAAYPLAEAVGLALVSFVWQGAAIALVTATALLICRRAAPNVRYTIACLALVALAGAPVVTTARNLQARDGRANVQTVAAAVAPGAIASFMTSPLEGAATTQRADAAIGATAFRNQVTAWVPAILIVWLTGVALLSLRLARGWTGLKRIRHRASRIVTGPLAASANTLATRLGVRRVVQLAESTLVETPTVIGWLRPTIFFPVSALTGLSLAQLDAIVAHELAHIRRHDYAVNVLQNLVETLLFYHPAVWWVSREIRVEREHCCDDIAAALCGDRVTYARALASLEETRQRTFSFGVAATDGQLLSRIHRLLGERREARRPPGALGLATIAMALLSIGFVHGRSDQPQVESPATTGITASLSVAPPSPDTTNVSSELLASPMRAAAPPLVEMAVPPQTPVARAMDQVYALEDEYRAARQRRDLPALARLLDDYFIGTTPNGVTRDKVVWIDMARAFQADAITNDSLAVRVTNDTAVANGAESFVTGGTRDRLLFMRVWRRSDVGSWTLVSNSQFRDPRPPMIVDPVAGVGIVGSVINVDRMSSPIQVNEILGGIPLTAQKAFARPTKLVDVRPEYPDALRAAGVGGQVWLEGMIDVNGNVGDVWIGQSVRELDEAVLAAVRTWKYTPARLNDAPVAVRLSIFVTFTPDAPPSRPANR